MPSVYQPMPETRNREERQGCAKTAKNYDTKIAAVVRLLGWCGMIGVVMWLAAQGRNVKA